MMTTPLAKRLEAEDNRRAQKFLDYLSTTYGKDLECLTLEEAYYLIYKASSDLVSDHYTEVRQEVRETLGHQILFLPYQIKVELLHKLIKRTVEGSEKLRLQQAAEKAKAQELKTRLDFVLITFGFNLMSVMFLPSDLLILPVLIALALICNACYVQGKISQISYNDI